MDNGEDEGIDVLGFNPERQQISEREGYDHDSIQQYMASIPPEDLQDQVIDHQLGIQAGMAITEILLHQGKADSTDFVTGYALHKTDIVTQLGLEVLRRDPKVTISATLSHIVETLGFALSLTFLPMEEYEAHQESGEDVYKGSILLKDASEVLY